MKKRKNNERQVEWEGFDDCAICRSMKAGTANTEEGLKKAFAEAEKEQKNKSRKHENKYN